MFTSDFLERKLSNLVLKDKKYAEFLEFLQALYPPWRRVASTNVPAQVDDGVFVVSDFTPNASPVQLPPPTDTSLKSSCHSVPMAQCVHYKLLCFSGFQLQQLGETMMATNNQ